MKSIFLVLPLADMLWPIMSHVGAFLKFILILTIFSELNHHLSIALDKNSCIGRCYQSRLIEKTIAEGCGGDGNSFIDASLCLNTLSYFNSSNFVGRSSSSSSAVSILYFLSFLFMKFKYARQALAFWFYPCNTACHISFFRRIHSCVVRNFRVRPTHPVPCKWYVVPRFKKKWWFLSSLVCFGCLSPFLKRSFL